MGVDTRLRSKLPSVGTTIFTVMSRLASDLGAINLSQGFPDFDCDPELVEAVARHMRAARNQYAPMQGVPALREAIAAKYEDFHGRRYDPETEVTVTSGGTEAIFDAVAARDQDSAEEALRRHLVAAWEFVRSTFANRSQVPGQRPRADA